MVRIESHSSSPVYYHSIIPLAETLAIGSAIEMLQPLVGMNEINYLISSAGGGAKRHENALDSLRKIFIGPEVFTTSVGDNEQLYRNLVSLQADTKFLAAKDKCLVLATPETMSYAKQNSTTGLAARYALIELLPFSVIGQTETLNSNLYGQYETLLKLDPKGVGEGEITEQWITARATLIGAVSQRNLLNSEADFIEGSVGGDATRAGLFVDVKTNARLRVGGGVNMADSERQTWWFGGDAGDTLNTSGHADYLFGGDGNDIVNALGGNDHIEGNKGHDKLSGGYGNDTLLGGSGKDTLYGEADNDSLVGGWSDDEVYGGAGEDFLAGCSGSWEQGDHAPTDNDTLVGGTGYDTYFLACTFGHDTIIDADGRGRIVIEEIQLRGGKETGVQTQIFSDASGYSYYEKIGNSVFIGRRNIQGSITVKNWNPNSSLGITLTHARGGISPLVLDLDGDGVETADLVSGVSFDHNADGFAERSGWVGSDDGLLVRDLDGDGRITSGRELFGSETLLPDGTRAANGFEALAALDGSGDGFVDQLDSAFGQMKIWRDADSDGQVDDGELQAPAWMDWGSLGNVQMNPGFNLSRISTGYADSEWIDSNGNAHRQLGSYTDLFGQTRSVTDVWFETDNVQTTPLSPVTVAENVLSLPDMLAQGAVYSLHEAMTLDPVLKGLVSDFVQAGPGADWASLVRAIVWRWTGADTHAADSRGTGLEDARWLYMAEALEGRPFVSTVGGGVNPAASESSGIYDIAQRLFGEAFAWLMASTHLKDVYDKVEAEWNHETLTFSVDYSQAAAFLANEVAQDRARGIGLVIGFFQALQGTKLLTTSALAQLHAGLDGLGQDVVESITNAAASFFARPAAEIALQVNNAFTGTAGADTLYGGAGNDTLAGGAGDDVLSGNAGNDTYVFGMGSGHDVISTLDDAVAAPVDRLLLGTGATPGNITLRRDGQDLVVGIAGTQDSVRISGHFDLDAGTSKAIDIIEFAGGQVWNREEIKQRVLADTASDDVLTGYTSADVLSGGDGNDALRGNAGADTIDGGTGDDLLNGGTGSDEFRFGRGDGRDTIQGEWDAAERLGLLRVKEGVLSSEIVSSRSGNALILAISGTTDQIVIEDYFYWAPGSTQTRSPVQQIVFANQEVWGRAHFAALDGPPTANQPGRFVGGEGEDYYAGTNGGSLVFGAGGDDYLLGGDCKDWLKGGDGADYLEGREDDDTLDGDAGDDTLFGEVGDDTLSGAAGADYLKGDQGNDLIAGGDGDDHVEGDDGHDTIAGEAGDDYVLAGAGNDHVEGGAGDDFLEGGTGNDTLIGGAGTDVLEGGAGDDTYVITAGSSPIFPEGFSEWLNDTEGKDVIRFEGLSIEQLTAHKSNDIDLVVRTGTGQQVVIVDGLVDTNNVYEVDGAGPLAYNELVGRLSSNSINVTDAQGRSHVLGGRGHEDLFATTAHATLSGGRGNDTLQGSGGHNTYRYSLGDGLDTVIDTSAKLDASGQPALNRVVFGAGITAADIQLTGAAGALRLRIGADDSSSIVLSGFDHTGTDLPAVDFYEFADGTVLTYARLLQRGFDGATGDDQVSGTVNADRIAGHGGNDLLSGDIGNDTLDGGTGSDTLRGGAGNDTYVWCPEVGNDVVDNIGALSTDVDTLRIEGVPAGEVAVGRLGSDLIVTRIGSTGEIRVTDYFAGKGISSIAFDEGMTWNSSDIASRISVQPTEGNDLIEGTGQADSIAALGGNDSVVGLGGADLLDGGAGDDVLSGGDGNDTLLGAGGWDWLEGGAGNDILDVGAGGGRLIGGQGNDVYLFGVGDGSVTVDALATDGVASIEILRFKEAVAWSDVTVSRQGNHLDVRINGTSDVVTLTEFFTQPNTITRIEFSGGEVVTREQLQLAVASKGTAGNDIMNGASANDILHGMDGDDTVRGWGGDDTLNGGSGRNFLDGGHGNDYLVITGYDTLFGGMGDDTLTGAGGYMTGGAGNDTYVISAGDNFTTITEGSDADSTADVLLLPENSTSAQVSRWLNNSTGEYDDVYIDCGIGNSVMLVGYLSSGGSANKVEEIRFADGVVWRFEDIRALVAANDAPLTQGNDSRYGYAWSEELHGIDGNDTLKGERGDDTLYGEAGNDELVGYAGNDVLIGGTGDDLLWAQDGDDTLHGGEGADELHGHYGNDTYLWNLGDGKDYIADWGGVDRLILGAGIAPQDVQLYRDGVNDDVRLLHVPTSSQLRIGNFDNDAIDRIEFVDHPAVVWDLPTILSRIIEGTENQSTGTAGNDVHLVDHSRDSIVELADEGIDTVRSSVSYTLCGNLENLELTGNLDLMGRGNSLDNLIRGNDGANQLWAALEQYRWMNEGADTLVGGAGDDSYYVDSYNDMVVEELDGGIDTVFLYSSYYDMMAHVENVRGVGSYYNQAAYYEARVTGNDLDNAIDMRGWADRAEIDGGQGADTMYGSSAGDIYVVGDVGDVVVETQYSNDPDTVKTSLDYVLGDFVENLILTGSEAVSGTGNDLENILDGSQNTAANKLDGGAGDDTYVVGAGDVIVEALDGGNDTVKVTEVDPNTTVVSLSDYQNIEGLILRATANLALHGDANDNVLIKNGGGGSTRGRAGNDVIADDQASSSGDDTLLGDEGNDRITSYGGYDYIDGGSGDDYIMLYSRRDWVTGYHYAYQTVVFGEGAGSDTVGTSYLGSSSYWSGEAKLQLIEGADARSLHIERDGDDVVVSLNAADRVRIKRFFQSGCAISGLTIGGQEIAIAHLLTTVDRGRFCTTTQQDDVLIAALFGSAEEGLAGNDLLIGQGGPDLLDGGDGADNLRGGEGADTLAGGAGDDTLQGGSGDDVFQFSAGWGSDYIDSVPWVEQAPVSGLDIIEFDPTVNANDIKLRFLSGGYSLVIENLLDGSVIRVPRGYEFDADETIDAIRFSDGITWDWQQICDRALKQIGTEGDDTLIGEGRAVLHGLGGNDSLRAYGDVKFYGGSGNDTLSANWGSNEIYGEEGVDSLNGGEENDLLDGGSGADVMVGGTGDDTYWVDDAGDTVTEVANEGKDKIFSSITHSLLVSANVESLELVGGANINATGNSSANTLIGNSGDNTLDGGSGHDTMSGGDGNDTYVVNAAGDVVIEEENQGIDHVRSGLSHVLAKNFEKLTLTGSNGISGTGNSDDNTLTGNSKPNTLIGLDGDDTILGGDGNDTVLGGAGNDSIDGGAGNDLMYGGAGNDTYVLSAVTDVVEEKFDDGLDTVRIGSTYTLGSNVDNLHLTGANNTDGAGNALANVLSGTSGANRLYGDAGNDSIFGGGGSDTLDGGTGDDVLDGGAAADTYLFGRGYGLDIICENDSTANVRDSLRFGANVRQADVIFSRSGNNLEALISGTADRLIVKDWYLGKARHVEEFRFSDNSVLTDARVENMISAMAGFDAVRMGQAGQPAITYGIGRDLAVGLNV